MFERIRGLVGRVLSVDELRRFFLHAEKIVIHPEYDAESELLIL